MKTENKIMCMHCPNMLDKHDTTCWQCGEKQEPYSEAGNNSLTPFVFVGSIIWGIAIFMGWSNGRFL